MSDLAAENVELTAELRRSHMRETALEDMRDALVRALEAVIAPNMDALRWPRVCKEAEAALRLAKGPQS